MLKSHLEMRFRSYKFSSVNEEEGAGHLATYHIRRDLCWDICCVKNGNDRVVLDIWRAMAN